MPFTNKEIQITDFLEQLHKRIISLDDSDALIFFDIFLKDELIATIKKHPENAPVWDGRVNAGDFDSIYPLAVEILRDAASRNFSEHSNTYKTAHDISVAFCEELNKMFQCSGNEVYELIPIKSYVDMAAEAGIIEIEDGMVKLTPEGEDIAKSVEREIKGGQN